MTEELDKRDSFVVYRSFYSAISTLPSEHQLEMYKALFEYSLNYKQPELNVVAAGMFSLIKPQLDANIRKYRNGKKKKSTRSDAIHKQTASKTEAKQKQIVSKTKAKDKQDESKAEANVNVNVNVNENENENDGKVSPSPDFLEFKKQVIESLPTIGFPYVFQPSHNVHFEGLYAYLMKYIEIVKANPTPRVARKLLITICQSMDSFDKENLSIAYCANHIERLCNKYLHKHAKKRNQKQRKNA